MFPWTPLALLGAAVLAVAGGWLLRDGRGRRRRYERLASARRTTAEDAAALARADPDGTSSPTPRGRSVVVAGTAAPVVGTLQAPFSERSALVADWRVDEHGPLRRRRAGTGVDAVPFAVEDDTGRALVWPAPGALTLAASTTVAVGADERAPDPVRRFLARDDAPDRGVVAGLLDGADRTYVESRIDPGDEVVVVGRPRPVATGDRRRGPDAAAADGGHAALSVADADVVVAFGPPWDDRHTPDSPDLGLSGADATPPLDADPGGGLVVTDRPVDRLAATDDDAAVRVAAGLGALVLAVAAVGGWFLLG